MRIGLVLEGGAMRALYSAGVLDVMMEQQLQVNGIVAVSAGALFGVNYFSNQAGRTIRYNLKYANDSRYMGIRSLLKTGNIVNKEFAYYHIPQKLDRFDEVAFEQYDGTFHVVITNVATGQAEYVPLTKPMHQMELLRATSAMPFVSEFIKWNDQYYLDGGIVDSIPLTYAQSLHFDKLIVVLTRPLGYYKKPARMWLAKTMYRHYPALQEAIRVRHQRYNQTLEQIRKLERNGEIFVIRPSIMYPIHRIERDITKLKKMYQLGIHDGQQHMDELMSFIQR